jgi:hypothetical protein
MCAVMVTGSKPDPVAFFSYCSIPVDQNGVFSILSIAEVLCPKRRKT